MDLLVRLENQAREQGASPNTHLYGVLYQPRGDTLDFQGNGTMTTPIAIITGTLVMQGDPADLPPIPTWRPALQMTRDGVFWVGTTVGLTYPL